MSDDNDEAMLMLGLIASTPGVSVHRLAKELGISLIEALRMANFLSVAVEGFPALIRLESKGGTSLATYAWLSAEGEALWNA